MVTFESSRGSHGGRRTTLSTIIQCYTFTGKKWYIPLFDFSIGMGEWYMKVVSESFDSFQLPEFDFFLRCVTHATRVTGGPGSTVSSVIAAIVRRLQVARGRPVSMPPLTDQSEPFGFVCIA